MAEELNIEELQKQIEELKSTNEASAKLLSEMKYKMDNQSLEIVSLKKANMELALRTSAPSIPSVEDALAEAFISKKGR